MKVSRILPTGCRAESLTYECMNDQALLARNAKVYIASYNAEKAEKAIAELKRETGEEAIFLKLDLADLKSVKAAADEFLGKEKELHVLFNNALVNCTSVPYDCAHLFVAEVCTFPQLVSSQWRDMMHNSESMSSGISISPNYCYLPY